MPHEIVFEKAKQAERKQLMLDQRYLRMAKIWSENSYAVRRQVGCLIVKDKMIISDGYNGTPSGFENVCEYLQNLDGTIVSCDSLEELNEAKQIGVQKLVTKPYVLHAEANAISKLAKSLNNSDGATLYVTDEPCLACSKMIIQSGIVRVVYWRDYHDHEGTDLLKRAGVQVDKVEPYFVKNK